MSGIEDFFATDFTDFTDCLTAKTPRAPRFCLLDAWKRVGDPRGDLVLQAGLLRLSLRLFVAKTARGLVGAESFVL